MLPIFLQTMELIIEVVPELSVVIPVAPNHHVETYIRKEIQPWSSSVSTILIPGASINQKYDAFSVCKISLHLVFYSIS